MRQVAHLEKNMPLSSYNVNQQLVAHFQQLLAQTSIPYPTLKSYIIAQEPLSEIHQALTIELRTLEAVDKKEAQIDLERKALEKQSLEDKDEQKRDERASERQDRDKSQLISELAINSAFRLQLEVELRSLEQQITFRRAQEAANTHQHGHPSTTSPQHRNEHGHPSETVGQANTHAHPSEQATVPIQPDPNVFKAQNIRQQLLAVSLRLTQIQSDLTQLERQNQQRKANNTQRQERLETRVNLAQKQPGVTIYDALSSSNQSALKSSISYSDSSISSQCTDLIRKAKDLNYSIFIKQLESSLGTAKYTPQEIEALQIVLNLMKQHQEHTAAANMIQTQLSQTISTISSYQSGLQQANARVQLLKQSHPRLIQANEALATKNTQLEHSQQENKQSRDKFTTPTWILAGIALVSSVPLILALSGVLAATMAPVFLFTLVSIVPALAFATSLGLGITALVYAIKGNANGREIIANKGTVEDNIAQMGRNKTELTQLEDHTIPDSIQAVQDQSHRKSQLEYSLQQRRTLAEQALQQAKATEPTQFLYPSLPSTNKGDAPPPYQASNAHNFFHQGAPLYQYGHTNPMPSAPPIDLMDDPSAYSPH